MDPMMSAAPANDPYAQLSKQATAVVQALSVMYKECHQIEPDGPLCNAIMQIMKAVSEVERHIKSHGPTPAGPPADNTPAPGGPEMTPAPDVTAPAGRGPFGAAAAGLHQDMMAAAKKRQPPAGY